MFVRAPPETVLNTIVHPEIEETTISLLRPFHCTFMSRNKQSRKYLIGRSFKNDEFDWPFLFGDYYCVR